MNMNKKISVGMAVSLIAIITTVAVMLTYAAAMNTFEQRMKSVTERQMTNDLLEEIDGKIRQKYYGRIDESALANSMAVGMIRGLGDENCAYLAPSEWELQKDRQAGYDFGLGLSISRGSDGNILVVRVTPNSPASRAGMALGDVITFVEGSSVLSTGYDKAVARMSSTTATVALMANRAGQEIKFSVTKAKFDIVAVEYTMIGDIGRINIYQFCARTPEQFNAAYSALRQAGAKALLIDLRDTESGGYETACTILDTILPQGNLMTVIDRDGAERVLYVSDARCFDLPISILINDSTAGAAELFCSNIYDYGKCSLVGTATKGLFTVQEYFELSNSAAVKLTTGVWRTDRGAAVKEERIFPDYEVKMTSYQQENMRLLEPEADPQIQTAMDILHSEIAAREAGVEPTEPVQPVSPVDVVSPADAVE